MVLKFLMGFLEFKLIAKEKKIDKWLFWTGLPPLCMAEK